MQCRSGPYYSGRRVRRPSKASVRLWQPAYVCFVELAYWGGSLPGLGSGSKRRKAPPAPVEKAKAMCHSSSHLVVEKRETTAVGEGCNGREAPLFDQDTSVVRSAGSIFGSHRWSSSSFSAMVSFAVSFCLSIRGILIRQYLSVARQSRRAICQRLMSKVQS